MKAKCPHCDNGCDLCDNGFVEVKIASGGFYTRTCVECGYQNGGRIVGPNLPPLTGNPGPCIECGNPTYWEKLGEIGEE